MTVGAGGRFVFLLLSFYFNQTSSDERLAYYEESKPVSARSRHRVGG